MVFVVDEGSEFKVPIDKVWKYNQSEGAHNHPSMKNVEVSMEGQSMVMSFDGVTPDGSTGKRKIKLTPLPPVGTWVEELEGLFAGSKYMNYYIPKGNKTGINVVGEFSSPTIPQEKLKKAALEYLDMVFKEDSANLQKF